MNAGLIVKLVVSDRLAWVDRMVAGIRALPLDNRDLFFSDARNLATAESYLRRALEALFDLGRHILAKGFAVGVTEYKAIATALSDNGVLQRGEAALLGKLAGYRDRLVHFYHEVGPEELYGIFVTHLADVETIADAFRQWLRDHPERLDETL